MTPTVTTAFLGALVYCFFLAVTGRVFDLQQDQNAIIGSYNQLYFVLLLVRLAPKRLHCCHSEVHGDGTLTALKLTVTSLLLIARVIRAPWHKCIAQ